MGYSQSKQTIDRVRPILELVLVATNRLEFSATNPTRLAYAIRDALAVAKNSKGEDVKYSSIRDRFKILTQPTKVIFELREEVIPIMALSQSAQRQEMVIPDVTTGIEVVGACITHKASKMIFPDFKSSGLDLMKIAGWCSRNGYMMTNNDGLTIEKL